jgi:hypothetical protein
LLLHRLDALDAAVVAQSACLIGVVALLEVSAIHRSGTISGECRATPRPIDDANGPLSRSLPPGEC